MPPETTNKPTQPTAPVAPAKDRASEVTSLRQENARLRARLAALGATVGSQAEHTFQLSEGQRQEINATGFTTVDGERLSASAVEHLLGGDQEGVELDPPDVPDDQPQPTAPTNIRGFDFVYPSVERGRIDPAVAGTPGISGPPASTDRDK